MNDGLRRQRVEQAAENATRIANGITALVTRIRGAQQGRPGAQSYDSARAGARTSYICREHERDLEECRRERERRIDTGEEPGAVCAGDEAVTIRDPIAEIAIQADPARVDERELDALVLKLYDTSERILGLAASYARARKPTPKDLRDTEDADPGCSSCARTWVAKGIRRWEPVYVQDAKSVGHPGEPLCSWCFRFARDNGELPTEMQVADRHAGRRVKLTATQQARRTQTA